MIRYSDAVATLAVDQFDKGFFDGWLHPPSIETHVRVLQGSYKVWLAIDDSTGLIVGFINAVSDGVLSAFIPLLEVVPAYKHQNIGTELVTRMLASLNHLYSIDLVCDVDLQPYYERFGMMPYNAMIKRNYARQSGG